MTHNELLITPWSDSPKILIVSDGGSDSEWATHQPLEWHPPKWVGSTLRVRVRNPRCSLGLLLGEPIKGWSGRKDHHKREATEEDNVVWLSSGCFCWLSEVRAIYQRVYPQDMEATLAALIQEIEILKRQVKIQKGNKREQLKRWRTKNPDKVKEQKKRWSDRTRQKVRAGETTMTTPTYTVETPCVVTVANTEPMRQPRQRTEPDGVKDTIPKEMLDGVASIDPRLPTEGQDESQEETILPRKQSPVPGVCKTVLSQKQEQNQGETKAMPSTKEEQAQRDPTLLNGRDRAHTPRTEWNPCWNFPWNIGCYEWSSNQIIKATSRI